MDYNISAIRKVEDEETRVLSAQWVAPNYEGLIDAQNGRGNQRQSHIHGLELRSHCRLSQAISRLQEHAANDLHSVEWMHYGPPVTQEEGERESCWDS